VGHEDEFLEVLLLGFERALDGCELIVEADALLLEPLDDLLVRLADALAKESWVEWSILKADWLSAPEPRCT
jgi:hypothetical protein